MIGNSVFRAKGRHYCNDTAGSAHYKTDTVEPLDLIFALGLGEGFCLGSIIKYAARFPRTQNLDDLKKVADYSQILVGAKLHEKEAARGIVFKDHGDKLEADLRTMASEEDEARFCAQQESIEDAERPGRMLHKCRARKYFRCPHKTKQAALELCPTISVIPPPAPQEEGLLHPAVCAIGKPLPANGVRCYFCKLYKDCQQAVKPCWDKGWIEITDRYPTEEDAGAQMQVIAVHKYGNGQPQLINLINLLEYPQNFLRWRPANE